MFSLPQCHWILLKSTCLLQVNMRTPIQALWQKSEKQLSSLAKRSCKLNYKMQNPAKDIIDFLLLCCYFNMCSAWPSAVTNVPRRSLACLLQTKRCLHQYQSYWVRERCCLNMEWRYLTNLRYCQKLRSRRRFNKSYDEALNEMSITPWQTSIRHIYPEWFEYSLCTVLI